MFRYYFKLFNNDGSINSIHNVIAGNIGIAYSIIRSKYKGLKPKLCTKERIK